MKIQERTGAGGNRAGVSAQGGVGERLPTAPRERKPALAALAVLLILVGALGATVLVLRAGDRIEVVRVTKEIPAGESPKEGVNIASVLVAEDTGIKYVKWSQRRALEDYKAKSTIPAGSVAVGQMFAEDGGVPTGKSTVGLSLKEGQYPSTLKQGDTVAAYRVATNGSSGKGTDRGGAGGSTPIVADARVNTVASKNDSTISTGNLSVTLLVDSDDAASLTAAASAGEVSLVVVPGNSGN
ncbi:hypothetical protein [Streptomyces spectabilis]|uniref:SAF domain-containing protein n=1 Tax=Streptomyces spectabilis TaxID=68270 RepID=A0A5P2XCU2_STRST|nr:hypothetical protein [Streptomyces spectabilis]MBB5108173.1 hypothetical protein [Streptomyces spectabilis]MCI3904395.1 hypothetical protein [Streptomyces spectabilis]QEV61494.1 hypothetical protein CP982_24630 [Streptomyces spectabilis]GGV26938.1 hypothetical protein GCM10010245_44290 [Streptomyces spectabilis]